MEPGELEVVWADPFSPTSYCYRCGKLMKPGEVIKMHVRPVRARYGKQQKKLKGNTQVTLKMHKECP